MITPKASTCLSEQRVIVVGALRNCEKTVRNDVQRLFESLRQCKALSWLVVESDSSDKTLESLRVLEADVPNFRFISLGSLRHTIPIRTQRIAHCRNVYLEQLNSNPLYSDIDFVVVADLDGVNNLISIEGFASCWVRYDWDVCTANQRGPYYDIWALRHRVWSPNDCMRQYEFLLAHKVSREDALWAAMLSKMIRIGESEEWIEIDSAFGGLAIYRRPILDGVAYSGLDDVGGEVCEHVSVNSQIRSNGHRIFINPRLINTAETDHARQRTIAQCLKRRYFSLQHCAKVRIVGAATQIVK